MTNYLYYLDLRLLHDVCSSNCLPVLYVFYNAEVTVRCTLLSGCATPKYCCEVVLANIADSFCALIGYVSAFHYMQSHHGFWFVCGGIHCSQFCSLLLMACLLMYC
jgi:hypothetical protein